MDKNLEAYTISRRVCVSDNEMKNLIGVETRTENRLAGATKHSEAEIRGKIVEVT